MGLVFFFLLVIVIVATVFIFIIKSIADNYSKKYSNTKISKYTFANSGFRMLIISIILIVYGYIFGAFIATEGDNLGIYVPFVQILSFPLVITIIWLIDYKLRHTLINKRAISILIIFEIILAFLITIPFLFAYIVLLAVMWQLLPIIVLLFINRLGNSLISNYPTDVENSIITDEKLKTKKLIYPFVAILIMIIVSLIALANSQIESYFAISFASLIFGFCITFFLIQKMDKKFMQLVYFQQNTIKYNLLSSLLVIWLFLPWLIISLVLLIYELFG